MSSQLPDHSDVVALASAAAMPNQSWVRPTDSTTKLPKSPKTVASTFRPSAAARIVAITRPADVAAGKIGIEAALRW